MSFPSIIGLTTFAAFLIKDVLATPSLYQWQQSMQGAHQEDWQKYVRSPSYEIVRPARVLSRYSVGNVTNPNGLVTGKGATILTRSQQDPAPTVVVDFGQNIVGVLSINFGSSYNTTPGLPGIRLAFSETLEYLSDLSDFTRSYNVRVYPPTVRNMS
jgi:hypothetical protein